MIKLENTEVYGWEAAIRGMRNPMNSWDKSDSGYKYRCPEGTQVWCDNCGYDMCNPYMSEPEFIIGDNDRKLMLQLIKAGSDHAKFLRYIDVTVDITAPMYWWKEMDTYKVGTVRNSCSTMHKVMSKEFQLCDFSTDHLSDDSIVRLQDIITWLNDCRSHYLNLPNSAVEEKKETWWQVIQLLPSSYNQMATMHLNYEVIRRMWFSRCKNPHKLDEWRVGFNKWVNVLPYKELITGGDIE